VPGYLPLLSRHPSKARQQINSLSVVQARDCGGYGGLIVPPLDEAGGYQHPDTCGFSGPHHWQGNSESRQP